MSSYRASLSTGTRKGGQSASAKHKYHTRQELYLVGREGVRDDLVASGSGNLPAFAGGDAGKYWLAVDSYERKNGRLFVELQLNLPRELSLEQQKEAVQSYASKLCDNEKLAYSWVIHHGKGENPHVHLMIQETKGDSIERPAEQHFKRFNSKYPERGGAQKTASLKPKQWLLDARAGWAIAANDALEAGGFKRHFDHRTLKEQRVSALLARDWRKAAKLDREVGEHEGWRVAALRRKFESGELDELPQYAKKVIESNDRIKALNQQHLDMVAGMSDAELERWEREAYFQALAEHEPERFKAELEQAHSEALELDGQLEPEPEPPAPQAAQDADCLEDEDMTETEDAFKQRQLAALAAMRAEKKADHLVLVQSEPPAAELEAEPAPKLRLVQPDERAEPEPVPEVAAEQQPSRLSELRAELDAQDSELAELAEQAQEADRFAAQQLQKAGELEQQYRESMRQQKELEAQADALEPSGLQAFFVFIARALGFRTESDRLRAQAYKLAGERFEKQRDQLLAARAQAASAKAEAAEVRQDLQDGKAQRAKLVDAVMLERGTGSLKKAVAREVQKVERLESDFEKLGSSKALELQQQREAITQAAEPSDEELLQQAKDLRELARSGARDYRGELLEVSKQAQKEAEAAYHQARETLRSAGDTLGSEYKKELEKQLDADRAHFFDLMKDPKKRSDPQLFRELASETRQLDDMMQQHLQEHQQLEHIKQLEQQQREAQPRQRQDHRSDFGL